MFGRNQMLWDLGMNLKDMNNKTAVLNKISELDDEFDLVMIAEKFDQSLLLLQNLLCWQVSDITYLKLNERVKGAKPRVKSKTRQILKNWLWADYLLYDHFSAKLDTILTSVSSKDFRNRLTNFRATNAQLFADCVLVKGDNKFLHGKYKMALPIVSGYVVDESKAGCDLYAISEPYFFNMIYERQMAQELQSSLSGN